VPYESDPYFEEILSALPDGDKAQLLAWLRNPKWRGGEVSDSEVARILRQLRHPGYSRRLWAITVTRDPILAMLLKVHLGDAHVIECRECKTFKTWTVEHFSHTPSGRLRKQCRECMKRFAREYDQSHPKSVRRRRERRRSAEALAGPKPPRAELEHIRIVQNNMCFYCGETVDIGEYDHKVPIKRGGSNEISNFVYSCRMCNRDKDTKTVEEFMIWRRNRGLRCRGD